MKILVSDAFDPSLPDRLAQFGEVFDDKGRLAEANVVLVRSKTKCTREYIDGAPELKLIIRGGVGIDNIDTSYAKEKGIEVEVAKFPWAASGRALTLERTDGLTKLIVEPKTNRILGVGIVGSGASELIAEGVLAIEMGANATDLKLTIHPHPTLSETLMEAAEVFFGQSTHVYRPRRK